MSSWSERQMLSRKNSKMLWRNSSRAKPKWESSARKPTSSLPKLSMLRENFSNFLFDAGEKLWKPSKELQFDLINLKKISPVFSFQTSPFVSLRITIMQWARLVSKGEDTPFRSAGKSSDPSWVFWSTLHPYKHLFWRWMRRLRWQTEEWMLWSMWLFQDSLGSTDILNSSWMNRLGRISSG